MSKKKKSAKTAKPTLALASIKALTAPIDALHATSTDEALEAALVQFAKNVKAASVVRATVAKQAALKQLHVLKVPGATEVLKAVLSAAPVADVESDEPSYIPDPPPWPHEVDGAALLNAQRAVFPTYSVLPDHADVALALWALYTHCLDVHAVKGEHVSTFAHNPLLVITSLLEDSGKTRLVEILIGLIRRPMAGVHTSRAALVRDLDRDHPTAVLDEADTYQNLDKDYRYILDGAHTRRLAWDTTSIAKDDKYWKSKRRSIYVAIVLALIGDLPRTVMSRALVIRMQRKLESELIADFTAPGEAEKLVPLKRQCIRWAADHLAALKTAAPSIPKGLRNRAADCWRPLFAIADLCGGPWPALAREAALALNVGRVTDNEALDLLRDVEALFAASSEWAPSSWILKTLNEHPDGQWSALGHKGLTGKKLSLMLAGFHIAPVVHYWAPEDWLPEWGPYPASGTGGKASGYQRGPVVQACQRNLVSVVSDESQISQGVPISTFGDSGISLHTSEDGPQSLTSLTKAADWQAEKA